MVQGMKNISMETGRGEGSQVIQQQFTGKINYMYISPEIASYTNHDSVMILMQSFSMFYNIK